MRPRRQAVRQKAARVASARACRSGRTAGRVRGFVPELIYPQPAVLPARPEASAVWLPVRCASMNPCVQRRRASVLARRPGLFLAVVWEAVS